MNESNFQLHTTLSELQSSVEQQLGRCMLCLQKYETLLKEMLPYASFSAHPATVQALLAEATNFVGGKTLGALVGILTETYLRPGSQATSSETATTAKSAHVLSTSSSAYVLFDVERHAVIRANLRELVTLRSTLVHHFSSRFNLECIEGCLAAAAFLQRRIENINSHLSTLRSWAETMVGAHTLLASVIESPSFRDFLSDGISLDGTVRWSVSGIVQGLRDAEAELALNGWTSLSSAVVWMQRHAPEQDPKRYGCDTWRQVLHASKEFDVFKQRLTVGAQPQHPAEVKVWYRSRRLPVDE